MWTRSNQLALLAVSLSLVVTLSGCGGNGRGMGATADPLPMRPPDPEAAMALAGVLKDSNSPAIAQWGARFPPPDPNLVTCAALTIDCEGGLGPIHYGSVREYDFSDFDFRERRRGVSLAEGTGASVSRDGMTRYRALAGWMDYSLFVIETPPERPYGLYGAFSMGATTGSNPDVLIDSTATWSGVMFGLWVSDPDVFVHGDALVTVSDPNGDAELVVDVEFTNIKDEDTGAGLDDVSWNGLELKDGSFGIVPLMYEWYPSRHPASIGISGRFYGSNYEEVGGIFSFTSPSVSGAFGAKRD